MKNISLVAIGEGVILGLLPAVMGYHPIAAVALGIICFIANWVGYGLLRLLIPNNMRLRSALLVIPFVLGAVVGVLSAVAFSFVIEVHPVVTVPFGVVVGAVLGPANAYWWSQIDRRPEPGAPSSPG